MSRRALVTSMMSKLGYRVERIECGSIIVKKTVSQAFEERSLWSRLQENHIRTVLDFCEVDCVLDVGANTGQFATLIRTLGYDGWIVSFEPISSLYEQLLERSASDGKWLVLPYALGDESGQTTISVTASSDFSSILPPNQYAQDHFANRVEVLEEQAIEIRTLEDALSDLDTLPEFRRAFVKLDTQGYDLIAYRGMASLSDRFVALQCELSMIPIYEGMPHFLETLKVFEDDGFQVAGFFPVTFEVDTPCLLECDCLMVRERPDED